MPIRLEVFHNAQRRVDFVPTAPMTIAADSVPEPGDLSFRDGLLRTGPVDAATAAGLLWNCGDVGEFHLETTRLVPRSKPYVLNVELARCRLMKLLQKVEDWGLIDQPSAKATLDRIRELQKQFAESLVLQDDPAAASAIADRVLAEAITVSDELSATAADSALARRKQQNAFARYVFGCRIDWTLRNQRAKDLLADHFDYAVVPFTWKLLQPTEESMDTAALDEWIEFLSRRRIPIVAGPLIELNEAAMPDWAYIWEHDFDVLRDLMVDFVRKMITRYRRAVAVWNVVGGLHAAGIGGISFEQTIELSRLLVATVKSMLPQARTLVTIRDPFGEHHASTNPGIPPMLYADTIAQAGVNCDGFGLEIETGVPRTGSYTRDLFQISGMVDRLASLGKPIYVTALTAPSRNSPDPADKSEGKLDPSRAGRWREAWSPATQATWLDQVVRVVLGKPFVESITWGDLTDANSVTPGGGIVDDMFKPKPAFDALQSLRQTYRRRETPKL
jgi:hypothetical protein